MDPMTSNSRRSKGGGWAVLALGLVLLLYVLGAGPAAWLSANGWIDLETFDAIYAPLGWVAEHNEFFRRLSLRHHNWWIGAD
jgi:hypothetical protein